MQCDSNAKRWCKGEVKVARVVGDDDDGVAKNAKQTMARNVGEWDK